MNWNLTYLRGLLIVLLLLGPYTDRVLIATEAPSVKPQNDVNNTILPNYSYKAHIKATYATPLALLDGVIIKQSRSSLPYLPFVKHIDFKINYTDFLWGLFSSTKGYTGGIDIIFRNHIQLSGSGGYDKKKDKSQGFFGNIGAGYCISYKKNSNLYMAMYYGRSWFTNNTVDTPNNLASGQLSANWLRGALGAESKLFATMNWYGGSILSVNYLLESPSLLPAANYYIPGHGSKLNKVRFGFKLYLSYKINFEKNSLK